MMAQAAPQSLHWLVLPQVLHTHCEDNNIWNKDKKESI